MKIVLIFAEALYAIHYDGEEENEYDRLMDLWTDVSYLRQFAKDNNIQNIETFVDEVSEDAEDIQDFMEDVESGLDDLDVFFRNYHNEETGLKELSLQKGKPNRYSNLRLYAIRIEVGVYLITGGAIKLVRTTQEREALIQEKQKLETAQTYLEDNGVFDKISFQDLKTAEDEDQ